MSADKIAEGDKVSWNWNGNHPGGTVGEVKAGEVSVTSHRGNEIKKTGDESNPAVHIERSGNDVVKLSSELDVEKKGSGESKDGKEGKEEEEKVKEDEKKEKEKEKEDQADSKEDGDDESKEPQAGEKRKADDRVDGDANGEQVDEQKNGENHETKNDEDENNKDTKKQKTANGTAVSTRRKTSRTETDASANDEKRKKISAKGKKAPTVAKTERRTRSQGKA
ncbi:MAG: hypothetical protein M1818_005218 [Claussenomyces sp. TS43310]|nr:MAG: hypothetical protein M1818_005218 [Claussenomyces sp. TS43310]